ncbi:ABC transporter ATP-binding protein [Coxiella burnetii]|uniref:ABC transporter ATP-binding protein n=2 Tax=Coxiella burnetii TaxID=777 RepID=Q83D12_COXBU|nr:ABC transporter ATP-binding protein [Coxiella burnetii]NP_819947.1 ABC transporter ATP-binding protein [Coxiella burnetii RSA 493]AAO90461.1 ABC transporter ATP-binding protein [Coxiella burnetii RSA 493]ABS78490.1 ABC transporter ATP-binding protein [Coxiella burnetii Dugway 5J108-111]ABX78579.1 ABC transporter, ATP-binding protein [Coxiella burnetii RSA 331]ACJ18412.1 ABC transporter ATP-binding protein [Coxiella burnetii CbuG_Q212]ACJ20130.1 ABC transporter ATP-binding protein [Coxiella
MKALIIEDLKKTYKNHLQALKGISFSVEEGDFFALLGPNGAGKSTTIGIITSLVNKTSGKVFVYGHDIDHEFAAAKACIGIVPQEFNFNGFQTVLDIVLQQAGYYGISRQKTMPRAEKYLKQLGLWEKRNDMARSLSGGLKRRLMIVRALIHEPQMLILDEPTAGVDIEIRRSMWQFLQELNQGGRTIILTTHYLEEAEYLCRNIAIIDHGKIIENTTMSNILTKLDAERFILYLSRPLEEIPTVDGYQFWIQDTHTLEVEVPKARNLTVLLGQLQQRGIEVTRMRNKANRLEELFIKLTTAGK